MPGAGGHLLTATLSLLFLLLAAGSASSDRPAPLSEEVLALVAFKSAVYDPTGALSPWSASDASPCGWPHVECDPATARVVLLALDGLGLSSASSASGLPGAFGLDRLSSLRELSLAGNNLTGPLPAGLSLLASLRALDLSGNAFSGDLPADDLPSLRALRLLDLSGNAFTGGLPNSFPPALRLLDLSSNQLSGGLPPSLAADAPLLLHLNLSRNRLSGSPDLAAAVWPLSRLRVLDLSQNDFYGAVPAGLAGLGNLKRLDLSQNRLFGAVPADLGLSSHLTDVDLSVNNFAGALPDSLRLATGLVSLSLSDNQLSGALPDWLGDLAVLQHLDLSNNAIAGGLPASLGQLKELTLLRLSNNQLTGSIPESISGCGRLAELWLRGNRLNGSIPESVFGLGLRILDLSGNCLTGDVPWASAKMAETLQWLDLSRNQLVGGGALAEPPMSSLKYLNLSWNELGGPMPPELGLLGNLSMLDMRSSGLRGSIPADICQSGSITVLRLDGNALTGSIPDDIGKCSSLYFLTLSHNGLSGVIPATIASLRRLEILRLEYNELTGEIPPQLGELDSLLAVNVSHNRLVGRLPASTVFQTMDGSALEGNVGLCSPLVHEPCLMNVSKPLVLDPDVLPHGDDGNDGVVSDRGPVPRRRRFLSISAIVAISAAAVIAVGVLMITLLNMSARRRLGALDNALESMCSGSTRPSTPAVGQMVVFGPVSGVIKSDDDLAGSSAEQLFAKATEIGRGSYGTMTYKAVIGKDGRLIAIKKLPAANVIDRHDDFDHEVRVLAKARHPNILPLKGYYFTQQLQLLVSEYAPPESSLESRLHGGAGAPLTWAERFAVLLGTARGLAYLHGQFRPPIIHYDVRPGNVFLDERGEPRIADFGLARLMRSFDRHGGRFQCVAGGGSGAPELACGNLRVNEKCDIFGFGVMALEMVTGRRAVEYGEDEVVVLVDKVRARLEQGAGGMELVDPAAGEAPEEETVPVLKLGLVCASQIPSSRPTMAEVVQILQVIRAPLSGGCRPGAF